MFDWFRLLVLAASVAVVAACGGSDDDPARPPQPPGTLAGVAAASGFKALVAAADKAGLVPALGEATSDLTVFAPTDATVASLAATLASILQYHVLPARQTAAQRRAGGTTRSTLYSFEGAPTALTLDRRAGVKITDGVLTQAAVVTADAAPSNGIIHAIDKVLVPPGVLSANLAGILTYHVVLGNVRAADVAALPKPAQVTTVQGTAFTVDEALRITDGRGQSAGLMATDVIAANGVIHVIDQVILPAP